MGIVEGRGMCDQVIDKASANRGRPAPHYMPPAARPSAAATQDHQSLVVLNGTTVRLLQPLA